MEFDHYVVFNLLEALFWVLMAGVVYFLRNQSFSKYKTLAIIASTSLVLFGISDVLEATLGNFLDPERYWLFSWKILNAIVIFITYFRYVYERIKSK